MNIKTERAQTLILVLLLSITTISASLVMHWITESGPGVSPDSVIYLSTAENLLAGKGFISNGVQITHFPPGYPFLIALVSTLSRDITILDAARLLCSITFGINTALVGLAVFLGTSRSLWATALAISGFLVSTPVISTHAMAWSEGPFITCSLITMILLPLYMNRRGPGLLFAAALSAGFAMITRYAGIVLLLPLVFGLVLLSENSRKDAIRYHLPAVVLALIPLVTLLIYNTITAGNATHRSPSVHLFNVQKTEQLINTMYDFVWPANIATWIKALQLFIFLGLIVYGISVMKKNKHFGSHHGPITRNMLFVCIIFFIAYLTFLVVSVSFFDAQTPMDQRILLPALLAALIIVITLVWSVASIRKNPVLIRGFVLLFFVSLFFKLEKALPEAYELHLQGAGYTSRQWTSSQTIASVRSLPDDIRIYSDGPDAILFLTGRPAQSIPRKTFKNLEHNPDFSNQVRAMCSDVADSTTVLVYFNNMGRWFLPDINELDSMCHLPVLARLEDGVIFGNPARKQAVAAPLDD